MANIGVRSPYFIYYQENGTVGGLGAAYATLVINIGSTQPYSITKFTGNTFLLDISELIRDFVNPYYLGQIAAAAAGKVTFSYSLQFYTEAGTAVGSSKTNTHSALDGYNYFHEGNFIDGNNNETGFLIENSTVLLSGPVVWYPKDTAGSFIYINDSGALLTQQFGTTDSQVTMFQGTANETIVYIRRLQCTKYNANKIVFINKYGVLQEMWFTAKSTEAIAVKGDKYKSGFISANGSINRFRHQKVDYNRNGQISYTLNTTHICEGVTRYIEELLLSEQVWLDIPETYNTPSGISVFNVTNNGAGHYVINGESNPTLTVVKGQTYTFNINASGHPFLIKTTNTTGTANQYDDGVTNNGTDNGVITFTVPMNAPSILYYNCQYHSSMNGTINVIGSAASSTEHYPVNVTTSSVQYKNSVNDKLVNYTIEVEQANDLISTVR